MIRILCLLPLLALLNCRDADPVNQILQAHAKATGDQSWIENIVASASCEGPDGPYTTLTESSFTDDYLLFKQDYLSKNPFYALIITKAEGYGLDSALHRQGPLSEAVIAVLKAHEFHEMMLQPETRYFHIKLLEDTTFYDQQCRQLIASDHLGLPVRLYFDKHTQLMAGIAQSNPYKKGEVISVHFENWNREKQPVFFEKVTIHQGKKSVFTVNYTSIHWNDPAFQKHLDP